MTDGNGILQQDRSQQGDFQRVYRLELLFAEEPRRPDCDSIRKALEATMGPVDLVSREGLYCFALRDFPVAYSDATVPAQILMMEPAPFNGGSIGALERTQFWDCPQGEALLEACRFQVTISDFMASGLPYRQRGLLLSRWAEAAVRLLPGCRAVYCVPSGKLLTAADLLANPYEGPARFLHAGVNARFFRVQQSADMVVDTLGLYALGLPDVQYHFHGLDVNGVVRHAYTLAAYLYNNDAPIQSGDTVDGFQGADLAPAVQWKCQQEMALIQPVRPVLDVCAGEYAAGGRRRDEPCGDEE